MLYLDTIDTQRNIKNSKKYTTYLFTGLIKGEKKAIYCKRKNWTLNYFSDQNRPDLWLVDGDPVDFHRLTKLVIAIFC